MPQTQNMFQNPQNTEVTLRQTSFGQMGVLLKEGKTPLAEYLVFTKSGKKHQHHAYETFTVLSGRGVVYVGEVCVPVKPGDIVTIPPETYHYMVPSEGEVMAGLLWYHSTPAQHMPN